MGRKYEFKPDKNPGIGDYEAHHAKDKIMHRYYNKVGIDNENKKVSEI